MKKESLIKLVLNTQEVLDEMEFLVVGSQSIIGSSKYPDFENKSEHLLHSEEMDLICLNYNYDDSVVLEAIFGEQSYYHNSHKAYLQIVEEKTSILINNFQHRLNQIKMEYNNRLCNIYFLDEETLFIAKLFANREKDMLFLQEMVDLDLVKESSLRLLLEKNRKYLINKYPELLNNEMIDLGFKKMEKIFMNKKTQKEIKEIIDKNLNNKIKLKVKYERR